MVRNSSASKMEPNFYEEGSFNQNVNQLKRNLTLDLNSAHNDAKRARFCGAPVLSSPDLHKLKLGSPDLERLIISSGNLPTPTPSLFPRNPNATKEQESYVLGFVNALNEMHQSDSSQGAIQQVELPRCSSSSNSSAGSYGSMDPTDFSTELNGVVIKDEPQTVPNLGSPPVSPINMECQERIKLERKRQRNRVAASKCRRRKLERIAKLEDKVRLLKGENNELSVVVNKLKDQVCNLKQQVLDHVQSGCAIMPADQSF
ncbi:transcription factor AP-1 [Nilaparvata lugens]|uniref:transcription factor AP-1 n=1 Tax=Nilaparvata lugens TaxID=108931 RepID=UPI000B99413F|nr:transcription factor AP-1 [Nilaparvata lugens]